MQTSALRQAARCVCMQVYENQRKTEVFEERWFIRKHLYDKMGPGKKNNMHMGEDIMDARKAVVCRDGCVACGTCLMVCGKQAIRVMKGCYAQVDAFRCEGCGNCAAVCPTNCISLGKGDEVR